MPHANNEKRKTTNDERNLTTKKNKTKLERLEKYEGILEDDTIKQAGKKEQI